jgi:hypothetical protein
LIAIDSWVGGVCGTGSRDKDYKTPVFTWGQYGKSYRTVTTIKLLTGLRIEAESNKVYKVYKLYVK